MSKVFDTVITSGLLLISPQSELVDESGYRLKPRVQTVSPIDLDCSFVETKIGKQITTEYKCIKPKQPVDKKLDE